MEPRAEMDRAGKGKKVFQGKKPSDFVPLLRPMRWKKATPRRHYRHRKGVGFKI
jgi:hypothetical protein